MDWCDGRFIMPKLYLSPGQFKLINGYPEHTLIQASKQCNGGARTDCSVGDSAEFFTASYILIHKRTHWPHKSMLEPPIEASLDWSTPIVVEMHRRALG